MVEIRAIAHGGERRQGSDDVLTAGRGSIVGFEAPDRHENVARHAEAPLDPGDVDVPLRQQGMALRDSRRCHGGRQIGTGRLSEFGLSAGQRRHGRVRRDFSESGVEGGGGDAATFGFRLQRGNESRQGFQRRRLGHSLGGEGAPCRGDQADENETE